jgi:hypothetical protein
VRVADEEQEQRVAAELQHVAAVPLRHVDQLGEDRRDRADELLGALAALRRQPFRQRGEARDIDRDEGTVQFPGPRQVTFRAPATHEAREVRGQLGSLGDRRPGHLLEHCTRSR